MTETITFKSDTALKSRLDFVCKELGLEASAILSEAFNTYFRRLITDGKIKVDVMSISLSNPDEEKDYSLTDPQQQTYTLTPEEIAGLGKAQLKNYEKAMQGDPKALNVMGTYYESGNGMSKDYERAIYWYTLSADKGNSNAQYHLAILYNKVKDNPLRSYYWFEVARLCGFNITALHQDYILRLTERLSERQIKAAEEEAMRKFSDMQKNA